MSDDPMEMTPFKRTMWELAYLWLREHAVDAAPNPQAEAVTRLRDLLIFAHDMGAKTTEHQRQMERELFTEAMKVRPNIIHINTPEGTAVLTPKEPEPPKRKLEPECLCGAPWVARMPNGACRCGSCLAEESSSEAGLDWSRVLWRY